MKVLVTGADGFVGAWVIRELLRHGHHVVGAIRIGAAPPRELAEVSSSTVRGMVGFEGWEEVVARYVPMPVLRRMQAP